MSYKLHRGRMAAKSGQFVFAIAFGCLMALAGNASALEIRQKTQVIELFTSQGCSSCPPADALLRTFGDDKDILGLAWHVDYWDYLGWKDVFGSAAFTERQKQYAQTLNAKSVYTPQAVVNGRAHAVGSSESKIRNLMQSDSGLLKPMDIAVTGNQLAVDFKQNQKKKIVLVAVWYDDLEKTAVKRGENRGKTIAYSDIVKTSKQFAMGKNGSINTKIAVKDLKGKGQNCALLVQEVDGAGNPSTILSAAVLKGL